MNVRSVRITKRSQADSLARRGFVRMTTFLLTIFILTGCENEKSAVSNNGISSNVEQSYSLEDIPDYSGNSYVAINDNQPEFTKDEITETSFERYSELDRLGRCGVAEASVGIDIMPKEKRESISQVKPTGWHSVRYDFVDGDSLYNRCHLIGYQLTGENANEKNLITGTRYLNVDGMLPFENMVADYVKETENHVMYRVTPVFEGEELVARGVLMEGYSVEDDGEGISFNVFCYNVQPKVAIDYATGDSSISDDCVMESETTKDEQVKNGNDYILNMNTHKFHLPECSSVKRISEANKGKYTGTREDLIEQGYEPCGVCNP